MKEEKKVLESGAELFIQMGSWEESHQLYKAVMAVVSTTSIKNDEVLSLIAKICISPEIEAALWKCLGRATYNGAKITKATFEDEKAREDYLVIAKEVLVLNLRPFLKNLASLLPAVPRINTEPQK